MVLRPWSWSSYARSFAIRPIPRAFFGNAIERLVQLLLTVAAERVKDVAREALRMDPHDRGCRVDIAHDQGHGGFDADGGRGDGIVAGNGVGDDAFVAVDA